MEEKALENIIQMISEENYVAIKDIITYTITLNFKGRGRVSNIVIRSFPPEEVEFVYGTVVIDGEEQKTLSPQSGVCLLVGEMNRTYKISFKVKLIKAPPKGILENRATISYDYFEIGNGLPQSLMENTNTVKTIVNTVDFFGDNIKKYLSDKFVEINDEIEYIYEIKNGGNIVGGNVVLREDIPRELEFVEGSVVINDIPFKYVNPCDGISLGSIRSGEEICVKFKVLASLVTKRGEFESIGTLSYGELSNPFDNPRIQTLSTGIVKGFIESPCIEIIKSINKKEAIVDEIVSFKVELINTGNVSIKNIKLYEEKHEELKVKMETLKYNGREHSGENMNSWISIESLEVGEKIVITYDSKIVKTQKGGEIYSASKATYSYILHERNLSKEVYSNKVKLLIERAKLSLKLIESRSEVTIGEMVTKCIRVKNEGTISTLNTFLFINNPEELCGITEGIYINGVLKGELCLNEGIPLYDIAPEEEFEVRYTMMVMDCGEKNSLCSECYLRYEYKISETSLVKDMASEIVESKTYLKSPLFKQLSVDGMINIGNRYEEINEIDEVKCDVFISNHRIVNSGGFNGATLAITGYIVERVQYTVFETSRAFNVTCSDKTFSTYISLKDGSIPRDKISIEVSDVDVTCRKLGRNSIYTNICFNITGKIK